MYNFCYFLEVRQVETKTIPFCVIVIDTLVGVRGLVTEKKASVATLSVHIG